ncbi:MAG: tetratricopeptide repeat protein [Candidatus Omnitrophota bacterium]
MHNKDSEVELFNKGKEFLNKRMYDEALVVFSKVIQINPNNADAYNNRGNAYVYKGEFNKAIIDFDKAIELNSNSTVFYNNRGLAYVEKGNLEQALANFDKAVFINPNDVWAYSNRGNIYASQGNFDQAITDFNKAIQLAPDYAEAYNNRGIAYMDKGNINQTITDFSKAIEINPNDGKYYSNRAVAYFRISAHKQSWRDIHKAEVLEFKVNPEFVKELKKASRMAVLKNISWIMFFLIGVPLFLLFFARQDPSRVQVISIFLLILFVVLFVSAIILVRLKDPLKRCPLCKSKLTNQDYRIIEEDGRRETGTGTYKIIKCNKCNQNYKIVRGRI